MHNCDIGASEARWRSSGNENRSARMKARNPHYRDQVRAIFDEAPFIADLGLVLSGKGK
jgi:hypothetical protein